MTTKESEMDHADAPNLEKLTANLEQVEALSKRIVDALAHKRQVNPALQGPDQELFAKAAAAYVQEMMANPAKIVEHQIDYWKDTLTHYVDAQQKLAKGKLEAPKDETPRDRRFRNPLWETHPYFNFLKQHYMRNAAAVDQAVADIEGLDARERKRVEYFTRQIMDLFAPTNFLASNPDALEKAVETEGQSLIDGLENLVADIEANQGEVQVSLADRKAFTVGENLATTPGEVIFRNRLFELIQYTPTTEQVYQTPLILFPPWINKFYILDLKEQNSLIKWIVDQGFTLFVVSWVNPDASYRDTALDDYVEEGYLTAIREVQEICKVKKVNVVGYCIAGTTLSLTMALLKKRGEDLIKSATLFTTLTDFSDQGEVGVFLSDDFVGGIEEQVEKDGYLSSFFMSRTFSFLRSNDLIYQPAIKSYMMGEAPPAFDLLYWNGDGTNLPAKMAVQYLRGLCQDDQFAKGGFPICGQTVHISDVKTPICAIACETDHIAAWDNSYRGVVQMGSKDKTFIVSESGHIAGIVNPPTKQKYGHYTNEDLSLSAEDWMKSATYHEGSWWPRWGKWLAAQSGRKISARNPGDSSHPALEPAPGTYVKAVPSS